MTYKTKEEIKREMLVDALFEASFFLVLAVGAVGFVFALDALLIFRYGA